MQYPPNLGQLHIRCVASWTNMKNYQIKSLNNFINYFYIIFYGFFLSGTWDEINQKHPGITEMPQTAFYKLIVTEPGAI